MGRKIGKILPGRTVAIELAAKVSALRGIKALGKLMAPAAKGEGVLNPFIRPIKFGPRTLDDFLKGFPGQGVRFSFYEDGYPGQSVNVRVAVDGVRNSRLEFAFKDNEPVWKLLA
jgi:hypothetical protein